MTDRTEREFEFDLVIALPDREADMDALIDALFDAGFDDAVIGTGSAGLVGLSLCRKGPAAEDVIGQAAEAALSALPPGSRLREVKPDLVSQADVAARLNVTRQALQKRDLPPPSLGGLYRATELFAALAAQPGKVADALKQAQPWVASAPAAQKINARLALDA